ncbi:MAG: M67 family peptidase [Candidatus Dadabacteria bacterium]|nr:MAG: M67 family peptidase [Candidatus Dadabacteria bacterium]
MTLKTLKVPANCDSQMKAHLEAAWPNEGCGILIGRIDGDTAIVTRVVDAENQNTERGADRFEIDPMFYYRTERELADGERVIGFVHSHPDCPAVASETDRQFALNWPGFAWLIYRVDQRQSKGARTWIINDDTSQFEEIETIFTDTDN